MIGLDFIASALLAGSAFGCLYLAGSTAAVRRFRAPPPAPAGAPRPVSVLKPLCGEDPDLYRNLQSFCRQDYPVYQLVFGVRDPADPAIPVVRRLMAEFPAADLVLVVDDRRCGANLKVANLRNMLPAAHHSLLVIADSDIRVTPDYLRSVTAPLADPEVGVVTCLYRGIPAGGIWSRLAALHINHGFLPQAAADAALGATAGCFGATIALHRDTLDRIGGFGAIADSLADDHALGAAVRRRGGRIALSPYLVDNIVFEPSLAALFQHELRWARTIRLVAPYASWGLAVTHPVILALAAVALGSLPVAAPAMLAAALICRIAAARATDRMLDLPPAPLWLLPLRDVLSFAVFIASFFARTVAWRNGTFRIDREGQLTLDGDSPA